MRKRTKALALAIPLSLLAAPAYAGELATQIPEAGGLALFGLGVAGVVIGRHMARSRPDDE